MTHQKLLAIRYIVNNLIPTRHTCQNVSVHTPPLCIFTTSDNLPTGQRLPQKFKVAWLGVWQISHTLYRTHLNVIRFTKLYYE